MQMNNNAGAASAMAAGLAAAGPMGMAVGAALAIGQSLLAKRQAKKQAAAMARARNLQAAADTKQIDVQSNQMMQQAAEKRLGLSIKNSQQGAANEARTAAMGGMGGTMDRTSAILSMAASRADQSITNNLNNQLFQQELNKVSAVNGAASYGNSLNKGPSLLDTVLAGANGAMQYYGVTASDPTK
ncbi:virion core protein, T7 gp14 family [Aeromonas veronii]|uniref:virion core protein, T7 gp14 family n=1 Tax=Aeromonas veronii TaxID=654 RepID=UPI003BA37BEA